MLRLAGGRDIPGQLSPQDGDGRAAIWAAGGTGDSSCTEKKPTCHMPSAKKRREMLIRGKRRGSEAFQDGISSPATYREYLHAAQSMHTHSQKMGPRQMLEVSVQKKGRRTRPTVEGVAPDP